MVSVAIMGIIASIAIPNFKNYKYKTQATEAYINLGTIGTGLKAYYQQEHHRQGVVSGGKAAVSSGCLPDKSLTSNSPWSDSKTMLNWENEAPGWRAIGFTPADPIRHSYNIKTCWGEGSCSMASLGLGACGTNTRPPNGYNPGCCGHNGLTGGYIARARGEMAGSINNILTMYFCSTDDNDLYVCGRKHGNPGCGLRIAPKRAPSSTVNAWVVLVLGLSLGFRRNRKKRGQNGH